MSTKKARQLIQARLRDDAITRDYDDGGIGTAIFDFVRDKGYRILRLERNVDRTDTSTFVCEFWHGTGERHFKMTVSTTDTERYDIKFDNITEGKARKLRGEHQHALELLKVFI